MASLRRQEGYLLIDNSCGPGVPDALIQAASRAGKPPVGGRGVFESATVTCAHCHAIIVLNPDRSRPRHYCPSCDHYVCDAPACCLGCSPLNKVIDHLQEQAVLAQNRSQL